ncbi:MAG: L,D-transpeptidase [Bdellovibrionales bacterium]|nr:L,D-transpeptidase [Bdellovibrionales bacterium]
MSSLGEHDPIIGIDSVDELFTLSDGEAILDEDNVELLANAMGSANDYLILASTKKKSSSRKATSSKSVGGKLVIKVSKKSQRLYVYLNGVKKYNWPTTTGSVARYGRSASTPTGTYTPYGMTRLHKSKKYKWSLPYAIKVTGGYFIHAIGATGGLGKPLSGKNGSHGCIRLSKANAKTLYNLVERVGRKNTRVTIY